MSRRPRVHRWTAACAATVGLLAAGACDSVKVVKPSEGLSQATNLDFEGGTHAGNLPNGWSIANGTGSGSPDDYAYDVDAEERKSGSSLRIRFVGHEPQEHGGVYQCLQRPEISRREIALQGFIKAAGAEDEGASLWMQAYDEAGESIAFENMDGRRAQGTRGWESHEITIEIPPSKTVTRMCFGFFHDGRGTVWIDDVTLQQRDGEAP